MKTKPIDPLDMTIWQYDYVKCAMSIYDTVPVVKKLIEDSDKKLIIASAEDIIKEMGADFQDKSFENIYVNLRFVMLANGIVIKSGYHTSGKRLFIMRFATYRDKIPESWKKRSKFLKRLMKNTMWKEMIESRRNSIIGTQP